MEGSTSLPATRPQPDWVERRRLHVRDYHRMGEAGILRPEDRVELIEGELIAMSSMGAPHILRLMKLNRLLVMAVGDRAVVAPRLSARLGDFSEPEPDFALVRPSYLEGATAPPTPRDILLIIEVSDSSLRYDRTVKASLYARHRIAEYWILDLGRSTVLVHRDPQDQGYAVVHEAASGEALEPLGLPGLRLAVSDMLG